MRDNKLIIILIICILLVMAIMGGLLFWLHNQEEEEPIIPDTSSMDHATNLFENVTVEPLRNTNMLLMIEQYLKNALNTEDIYLWRIYVYSKETGETYFTQIVTNKGRSAFVVINTDNTNFTYGIEQITETEFSNAISGKVEPQYLEDITIESNGKNGLKYYNATEEEISRYYFDMIKELAVNCPELIYERLTEEYKAAKFNNSYEEFVKFCSERKDFITSKKYYGYQTSVESGNKVYVCRDTGYNIYRIVDQNAAEFTLELDEYTVYSEEFIKLYNESEANTKVATNVQKFIKLVNNQDYTEAYKILNENFKNNNFPTKESYAKYLSENYNKSNIVTIKGMEEQGEYYLVTFEIKPGDRMTTEEDIETRKIAIKLGENTEFEMSIIIEE